MNIYLSFDKATTFYADREAIVDGDKRFTYRQFADRVERLAHYLMRVGMRKGSVVAVLAPNCHEMMELYYACACTGIVLNPLNYRLAAQEIATILNDSQAKVLFLHSDFSDLAGRAAGQCPELERVVWIGEGARHAISKPAAELEKCISTCEPMVLPAAQLQAEDLAYLYYTSGTTGKAKGVMLSHGNVASNALGSIAEIGLNDGDTWAHVAPTFHLADAWSIFATTWVGGKHIFVPYFESRAVLSAFQNERATITVMVPTMVNTLLNDPEFDKYDCSSLRAIMTAGSPIAPEQVKKLISRFGCDYIQFYGMTETSPFLTISSPPKFLKSLPAEKLLELKCKTGRPFINVEVRVVRKDGSEVEKNDTEIGEIVARGPVVMQGYHNQPQITAETIVDGWIHTGDLAVIDQYGYINIVDRAKDMIISGGENVYSTEVEYALYEHAAVKECAVFGVPHPDWGEIVKAAVVLKPKMKVTEEELIAFVRERLARYKAPRSIDFMEELPKTGSGKIFKRGLREQHWQDHAKQVN